MVTYLKKKINLRSIKGTPSTFTVKCIMCKAIQKFNPRTRVRPESP